jgi:hypothetical protein
MVRPAPGRPRRARQREQAKSNSFRGARLADGIGFWRKLRSLLALIVVTIVLGGLLAAVVAAVVGGIVLALQKALG